MHVLIKHLSKKLGIPIIKRNAYKTFRYDGKSIASYFSNGHKKQFFIDHDFLHEFCHYMIANEDQRRWPEYGLELLDALEIFRKIGRMSVPDFTITWGFVNLDEQFIQEKATQYLSICLGRRYNVPSIISPYTKGIAPEYMQNWEEYYIAQIMGEDDSVIDQAKERAFIAMKQFDL